MSVEWIPSEHGRDKRGLQKRVARGLMWTLLDTWGSQFLALVIFALLARLLQPVDFGLVALAAVFVALGQLLVDQGLGDAVIQRRSLTRQQLNTAFWAALLTGSLLCVGSILVAPFIARLLGDDRLGPIIQVLSLIFIMAAFSSIQMAILRREMNFRGLALRKLAAIGAGGLVGVTLAVLNFGPWALVGQQMVNAIVSVLMLWAASPWRPRLSFSTQDFRSLFGFGVNVLFGDLLGFLSRNTDNLLIGVFLGPVPLGFYAVAYRILDTSQVLLVASARRLVFPTLSRLQHNVDRLRRAYLRIARMTAAVTLPGYIGLALVAHEAIVAIFGQSWERSATAAAILFTIGPPLSLQSFSGAVWNAVGQPSVTLRFRLISTITNVVGFLIAVFVFADIVAVAAAYALRSYLLLPLNMYWMRRYAGVPIREHLLQWRAVALATLVMAGAVLGTKLLVGGQFDVAALLVVEVAVGIAAYGTALWLVDRSLTKELAALALQVLPGAERVARRLGVRIEHQHRRQQPALDPALVDEGPQQTA